MTPPATIVIPCFNEANRLPVTEFTAFLEQSQVEFIFVNDGSTDGTGDVLDRLRSCFAGKVKIISQPKNRGKAEAVRTGMNAAIGGSPYVGFWDADLATPLADILSFIRILDERPELDMVFGARVKLLGRNVERRAVRHYLGRVFATAVSIVLGLAIYDTQCGAKLFRVRPNTKTMFAEPFGSRWVFDVEILARYLCSVGRAVAARSIFEYPLQSWVDVGGSKVKVGDFVVAFRDVVRIYFRYMTHAAK